MRNLRVALLIPVFTCALAVNQARAIEISLAGDDCGSPDLLGLSFVVGGAGGSFIGCPTSPFTGMPGAFGGVSDGVSTYYGDVIESVEFRIRGLRRTDVVTAGEFSELGSLLALGGGRFVMSRLRTDPGIELCDDGECLHDVVFAVGELPDGRVLDLRVTAVGGHRIPEPAVLGLMGLALAGVAARRRMSGARNRRVL